MLGFKASWQRHLVWKPINSCFRLSPAHFDPSLVRLSDTNLRSSEYSQQSFRSLLRELANDFYCHATKYGLGSGVLPRIYVSIVTTPWNLRPSPPCSRRDVLAFRSSRASAMEGRMSPPLLYGAHRLCVLGLGHLAHQISESTRRFQRRDLPQEPRSTDTTYQVLS